MQFLSKSTCPVTKSKTTKRKYNLKIVLKMPNNLVFRLKCNFSLVQPHNEQTESQTGQLKWYLNFWGFFVLFVSLMSILEWPKCLRAWFQKTQTLDFMWFASVQTTKEHDSFNVDWLKVEFWLVVWTRLYLQDILHRDIHLQVLFAISLQPVVWKTVVIRCCEQISIDNMSRMSQKQQKWKQGHFHFGGARFQWLQ